MANHLESRIEIYIELESARTPHDLQALQAAMKRLDFGNHPQFKEQDLQAIMILDSLQAAAQSQQRMAIHASNQLRAQKAEQAALKTGVAIAPLAAPPSPRDELSLAQEASQKQKADQMEAAFKETINPPQTPKATATPAQSEPTPKRQKAIITRKEARETQAKQAKPQSKATTAKKTKKIGGSARQAYAKRRAFNRAGPKKGK